MSENIFLKPADFYQRELNPLAKYVEQTGFYLSKMTGQNMSVCCQFVENGLRHKKFPEINDPVVDFFERDDQGDRNKTETRLSQYIGTVNSENLILVPTGTCYINNSVKTSQLVEFIDGNVKRRSVAKKASQKAKADGNTDLYIAKENEQANMKLYNNSMSGTFAAGGSVLNNPTAHSTLTSITRSVSSFGNASNEKIISGNRHYRNPDITLFNIISITSSLNKELIEQVITKYNLHYPSVEETIDCISYSTQLYWHDEKAYQRINDFVRRLEPVERAGFVYSNDLFHIRKHNPKFIRDFLTRLSLKVYNRTVENPREVIKTTDEQVVNYAHQICMAETRGIGKDYSKMSDEAASVLAATCLNIVEVIETYRDLFDAFFLTKNVPSSTAYIPNMIRRSVVLSDTDSTMFSVDEWVIWYFGQLTFSDEAFAVAGSIMFIATQCIAHILAIFSANMNVKREKLFTLAMKPEFVFPVFAQTSVAKHYYTCIAVKEGNVYQDIEMEIKGVYLKNSASPKALIKEAQAKMKSLLMQVMEGKQISIIDELKFVADVERRITASLLNGETEYYKQSKIKNAEAYSRSAAESPYLYHMLWQEVFEPKYGAVEPPPYSVIKIPTTIENISALKAWLEGIEDKELAARFGAWLATHKKTCLPTFYMSTQFVKAFGIPKEIKSVINIKKIVLDLTITNRMVLESLGFFPKSGWLINELGY